MSYTRTLKVAPAWDKRPAVLGEPNYGVHCAELHFSIEKDGEGLTWAYATGWQLPHVAEERKQRGGHAMVPYSAAVGQHLKHPPYEGAHKAENCSITGGDCYGDCSFLIGDERLAPKLLAEGSDAVFAEMEKIFEEWRQ